MSSKRSTNYCPLNTNENNVLYLFQPSYRKFVLVFYILLIFTFVSLMFYVDELNSTFCDLNDYCNIKKEITSESTQGKYNIKEVTLEYKQEKYNIIKEKVTLEFKQEKYNIKEEMTSKFAQEKYITYLPHSGLHNQRIALENAVFMAWALNRTLILPPLILRKHFPFSMFENETEKL